MFWSDLSLMLYRYQSDDLIKSVRMFLWQYLIMNHCATCNTINTFYELKYSYLRR